MLLIICPLSHICKEIFFSGHKRASPLPVFVSVEQLCFVIEEFQQNLLLLLNETVD